MSTELTPRLAFNEAFSPESRVWIYAAERPLTEAEAAAVQEALDEFAQRWTAHNQALQAAGELFHRQLIVLMVDETKAGASGCSIDASVHFLEALGHQLGVDLFDRMQFGLVEDGALQIVRRDELASALREGRVNADTLVANTLAPTRRALREQWLQPLNQSWVRRVV
jgi:hypothetical protein